MERSVLVRVRANLSELKREMASGAASVRGVGQAAKEAELTASTSLGRMAQSARQNQQEWRTAGTALVAFGALTVGALALTAKAAIDWESAWAGVTKTVSGTPAQLAAVEDGLRGLATTLPSTHGEIAAVAEAAGQLGVATGDVVDFTKVMIDLGETTNLTADEAATSIAQLMNIMQTAPEQVSNLGSALVALGNDGASTERDIIQMAQRIAGAGQIIGLTEAEVLSFANALASVGIEVEAGGTAISRVMTDIAQAVSAGGEELDGFAQVAGVSSEEFARAFRDRPAEAITLFVEGLDRINRSGGDVFGTLSDLGQSDIRVSRALLSMAGAGDLLRDSLELGNAAWAENTALQDEAAKRYETTAAQLEITKNNVVDAAISFGSLLLPAISAVAGVVADVARFFAELPAPIQGVVAGLGGLVGVAALVAGGFLLIFPRVIATVTAFRTLRDIAPGAATGLSRAGRAARTAGIAFTALLVLNEVMRAFKESEGDMRRWAESIETAAGADTQAKIQAIKSEIEQLDQVTKDAANTDLGFVNIFWTDWSGNAVQAADRAEFLRERLAELEHQQQTQAAETAQAAASMGVQGDALDDLAIRFGLTGDAASEAALEMIESWSEASTSFVDVLTAYQDALAAKEEAERKAAEAAAEAAGASASEWEEFADAVEVSIADVIEQLEAQLQAQAEWAENLAILAARGVDAALYDHLVRLGPEGAGLVQAFAEATDAEFDKAQDLWRQSTGEGVAGVAQRLAEAGPILRVIAAQHGQDVADSIALGMAQNATTVQAEARRQGVNIDEGVGTNRTRRPPIRPELEGVGGVQDALNNLARDRTTTIHVSYAVTGSGLPAGLVRSADGNILHFAAGGENHVAQITGGGPARVWSEPETGGEAYIPLAESKRGRSTDILGAVADRFGYQLIRANAMRFADGGIVTRAARPHMVSATTGGEFRGNLYLDSGQFLGVVRGEITSIERTNARDADLIGRIG